MVDRRRVMITGCGVVSALANDLDGTWAGLLAGRSGVGAVANFDAAGLAVNWGANVKDFDARDYLRQRKAAKLMDRRIQLAIGGAVQAGAAAGLEKAAIDATRFGSYVGTGLAALGADEIGEALRRGGVANATDVPGFSRANMDYLNPLYLLRRLPNMVASHVTVQLNAQGPSNTSTCDSAAGLQAIGEAARWIRHGEADLAIAGGADSRSTPFGMQGLVQWDHLLSRRADRPAEAHRPFDRDRDGFVLGEGAGLVVLEDYAHARKRGARILGEVVGYASATDPARPGRATADGAALQRALKGACHDALIEPAEIDGVFAAGLATREHDLAEARAIRAILGEAVPVTASKAALGNSLAASGAIDTACALRALAAGVLPATRNLDNVDPECGLAHVRKEPRTGEYRTLAVNALALGGLACALILRRVD